MPKAGPPWPATPRLVQPGATGRQSCGWPPRTCCLQPSLEEGGTAHYPGGQHRRPSRHPPPPPPANWQTPGGTTGKETPAPGHVHSRQLQAEPPQTQAGGDNVRSICPRTPGPSLLAQVEVVTSQDGSGRPQ